MNDYFSFLYSLKETLFSLVTVIPCFYIYAEEEKFSKKDASVCSKNISSPIKDHESDPDSKEETWEVEDYEYDRALNADRIYLKFKKRVDAYPEQCFRYNFKKLAFVYHA